MVVSLSLKEAAQLYQDHQDRCSFYSFEVSLQIKIDCLVSIPVSNPISLSHCLAEYGTFLLPTNLKYLLIKFY